MMTKEELEQTTLLFLKLLYDIVSATDKQIYEINLTKVAEQVGLKTVPSQDVLYGNFPTSVPTIDDAIRICDAGRKVKQESKAAAKQKDVDALSEQRDKLQKEVIALTNLRDNTQKEIKELNANLCNFKAMQKVAINQKNEIDSICNAINNLFVSYKQILDKYQTN